MAKTTNNPDITVRGGVINYPLSTVPNQPPRHQPDTPRTKKTTVVRADHQIPDADKQPAADEPAPPAAVPPDPPPDEPSEDSSE